MRTPILAAKRISRSLAASALLAAALSGGPASSTSLASAQPALPAPAAAPVDGTCGPLRVAFLLDLSVSYRNTEFREMRDQVMAAVQALSEGPVSAEVAIYGFARDANVGDAKLIDGSQRIDNVQGVNIDRNHVFDRVEVDDVPANHPLKLTTINTADGLATVKSKVNGLYKDVKFSNYPNQPHGFVQPTSGDQPDLAYAESTGTNWDAGFKALQDSGENYDVVMFVTDGIPNMTLGMPNRTDFGRGSTMDDVFVYGDAPLNAAVTRSKALQAGGTEVYPLFLRSTGDPLGASDTDIERMMTSIGSTGSYDDLEDYSGIIATALRSAALECSPALQVDKTVTTPRDALQPGGTITYDVTVRGSGDYQSDQVVVNDLGGAGIDPASIRISSVSKGAASGTAWNVGTLAVGEQATAKVTARIVSDWDYSSVIVNDVNAVSSRQRTAPTSGTPNATVREDDDRFDRETISPLAADVKVDKRTLGDPTTLTPGGDVSYKITVKNSGSGTARNVKVTDLTHAGLTLGTISLDKASNGTVDARGTVSDEVWTIGDMKPGEVMTATVTATLTDAVAQGDTLTNDVTVTAENDPYTDGTTPNRTVDEDTDNFDSESFTIPQTNLQVDKQLDTPLSEAAPGEQVSYTISVRNDGSGTARDVVVTERPERGFEDGTVAFRPDDDTKGTTSGLTWNVGDLAAGETATMKVVGTLTNVTDAEAITNAVSANDPWHPGGWPQCDANTGGLDTDTDQCDIVTITLPSKLQVDKKLNTKPEDLRPGADVSYTITALNDSTVDAADVVVTDIPGAGLDPQSISLWVDGKRLEDADPRKGGIQWEIGRLLAGELVTAQVRGTLAEGTDVASFTNGVTIENPKNPGPKNPGACTPNDDVASDTDQCDRITTQTPHDVDLKVDKATVTPDEDLTPGGKVSYMVTVKNAGTDPSYDTVVEDLPMDGLVPESIELSEQSIGDVKGTVWTVGTLGAGKSATVKVTGTVADEVLDSAPIRNAVRTTSPWDPIGENPSQPNDGVDGDTDQWDITASEPPTDLSVDKVMLTGLPQVLPGGEVRYQVRVRNDGPFSAADVTATDLPLTGLDVKSLRLSVDGQQLEDADPGKDGFQWAIGDMTPGQVVTAEVTANLAGGVSLEEFANAVSVDNPNNPGPEDPGNEQQCQVNDGLDEDSDQCDVVRVRTPEPDLRIVKTMVTPVAQLAPGDPVVFTVQVKNAAEVPEGEDAGTYTAFDVSMTDLPLDGLDAETVRLSDPSMGELTDAGPGTAPVVELADPGQEPAADGEIPAGGEDPAGDAAPAEGEAQGAVEGAGEVLVEPQPSAQPETPADGEESADAETPADGEESADAETPADGEEPAEVEPMWRIGTLAPGESATVTVTANTVDDLAEGATITNTATTWDPWDPYSGGTTPNDTIDEDTDQYDDSTATVPSGDLKVDKEIITSGTKPGDTVIYRLTARNDGPDVQGGITVTEKPGVGLEPGTVTLTDPSIGDVNGLTWTIGTLEPGQEETVTVTATLAGGIAGTDVLNAVTIENPLNPVPSTEQCEPNEDAASDRDQCDVVTITVPEPPVNSGGSNGAANAGGAGAHTGGEADTYGLLATVVAALGGAGLITAWRGRQAVGRKE